MTVGIAVVALAVASPTGAAAKKRHGTGMGTRRGGALSVSTPEPFGTADGKPVDRYTLSNGSVTAKIITYGGIIQELWAPDRRGRSANITLGYKDLAGYTLPARHSADPPNPSYFGAIIGRYGNRIGGAKFTLDSKTYTLDANNGPEQPPRRRQGLRQVRVGRPVVQDEGRGRAEADAHERGRRGLRRTRRRRAPATRATSRSRSTTRSTSATTCGSTTGRRPTRRRSSTSPTTRTGTCRARARGRSTTTG